MSDPGVTLIETFAYMIDQLIYRLNRVPDRNYIKFLELIGVRLFPPTAATPVTFWLSTSQTVNVSVPEGTVVATQRSEHEMAITYSTVELLDIVPCSLLRVATQVERGEVVDVTETLALRNGFACFSQQPRPGDCVLFGLSDPCRSAPSSCGSRPPLRESASIPSTPRWRGRRGVVTIGSCAIWKATAPGA